MTLLALILAVELGAGFGGAVVSGEEVDAATLALEVAVTLQRSPGPVVAHFVLPGPVSETVPLVDRGSGRWGATFQVRRADWRVVFEDVAAGALSEDVSLTELGLDPGLLGSVASATTAAPAGTGRVAWPWLAVALVAGVGTVAVLRVGEAVSPRHLRPRARPRKSAPS